MFTNFLLPAVFAIILFGILLWMFMPYGKYKIIASLGYLFLSAAFIVGTGEILGLAKPIQLEWRALKRMKIIGLYLVEEKAVYVWVRDGDATRLYTLPWRVGGSDDSQGIQDAYRKGMASGEDFTFDNQDGESAHVKADGVTLPPKEPPPPPPKFIQSPEWHPHPSMYPMH